jgi:hypothetical protein
MSPPGDIAFVGDRASFGEEPRGSFSYQKSAGVVSCLRYISIPDQGELAA